MMATYCKGNKVFERCAAPEAIRVYLKRAKGRMNKETREVDFLAGLLKTRLEQVERGEWPSFPKQD